MVVLCSDVVPIQLPYKSAEEFAPKCGWNDIGNGEVLEELSSPGDNFGTVKESESLESIVNASELDNCGRSIIDW